jgi:hypothetical protein
MPKPYPQIFKCFYLSILMLCTFVQADAQSLLSKKISISFSNQKLGNVLQIIGTKGDFYFSYNGSQVPRDSLVSVTSNDEPVLNILKRLLGDRYEFEERKNYVILTLALPRLSLINADITNDNNTYSVSGIVTDETSGERLMNASVYEKDQLVSALTDEHGYFKLRFRSPNLGSVAITLSKRLYRDTTIRFLQTVLVNVRNDRPMYEDARNKSRSVERTSLGRLFISTRQMIQSMNIPDFFASRPFQVSLTPGLSSHGMFSSQVVNKFSLNLIGGYTAGVNGLEIGGIFNINKQDTRYLQAAGIFNLVGGNVRGLQIAGVHNFAIDTVKGVQVAGFINKAESEVRGMQFSVLNNEAHKLKGLQIGLVNVADTSYGASIGLINIVRNGFYKVSVTANNLMNTNVTLKTGTHAFYSTLLTGANLSTDKKMYAFGLGIGHDFMFSKKFYASTEVDYLFANTGLWDDRWAQAKLLLNYQITKNISLIAGPTYNHYNHSGSFQIAGYKNVTNVPKYEDYQGYQPGDNGHQTKNFWGWEAGLAFNSVFTKSADKHTDMSHGWSLGLASTIGVGWDQPYGAVYGGELFTQRDLGNNLSAILSVGYTYFSTLNNYVWSQAQYNNNYTIEQVAEPFKIIPVKVGIRSKLTKSFYIGGDLGEAWGKQDDGIYIIENGQRRHLSSTVQSVKSFVYSPTFGFALSSGLDASFKFEDYTGFPQIKQFALRLAYRIPLSQ